DIEINTAKMKGVVINNFTTSDTDVDLDLLSVLTHEAGHFLGLAHTTEVGATMFSEYKMGSIDLRDLAPDDVNEICAASPPGREVRGECSYLLHHGYSPDCLNVQQAQN